VSAPSAAKLFLPILCLLFAIIFSSLGAWQIERLRWKSDLIAKVDYRRSQPPITLPLARRTATLDPASIEYRPVQAEGTFLHDRETQVQALTERGAGFWLVTPLRTQNGQVLVNRGFVPTGRVAEAARPRGKVVVRGLARVSEPRGRFLRDNKPTQDLWYSRDVAAIARARGLGKVAPFFIDADKSAGGDALPIGGLTIVRFRNAHLIYALTWLALAGLSIFAFILVIRNRHSAVGSALPRE
jgi:surfeit locus 1 family protein